MIKTQRFFLRALVENDASNEYLSWFADSATNKFIESANKMQSLQSLRDYIRIRENKSDSFFFGIFTAEKAEHIGNLKYEPVDFVGQSAEMGILIGNPKFRGLGVAKEVIEASFNFLRETKNIQNIYLRVKKDNEHAVNAYLSIGFKVVPISPFVKVEDSNFLNMVLSV